MPDNATLNSDQSINTEARVWKAAHDMVAYIGTNWQQDIKNQAERIILSRLTSDIMTEFRLSSPGDYLDVEWKNAIQAAAAEERADVLEDALKICTQALTDWLHTYAPDLCDPKRTEEAANRIDERGGTIGYLADVFETINAARLYKPKGGETNEN